MTRPATATTGTATAPTRRYPDVALPWRPPSEVRKTSPGWYGPLLWACGALVLAAGTLLRANRHAGLRWRDLPPPFSVPWERPPLFDLVTVIAGDGGRAAIATGIVSVLLCLPLARPALPAAGRLAVMGAAALCPAMVLAGAAWIPAALVVPLAIVVARLLADVLCRHDGGSPRALAVAAWLLLLADWPAWSPVLAWTGWLLVFRPSWLAPERARRASLALAAASGGGLLVYCWLLLAGADPRRAMGAGAFPLGLDAAMGLLSSFASPLLGSGHGHPPWERAVAASLVVALVAAGWRRASRLGAGPWASVLVVGSAGSLVPALAIHPLLPFGADKNLWYASPMVICLAVAALWPRADLHWPRGEAIEVSSARLAPVAVALGLLLLLASCTDEDEDGWAVQRGDCDDADPLVHPEAPELWADETDNDCDGLVDQSGDYVFASEAEPNDTTIGSCFAPAGDDIGHLAGQGLLTRITGRIEAVGEVPYESGDLDCFAFRVPDGVDHPRLQVLLEWAEDDTDLDLVLQGLWEGQQAGFGASQIEGPGPEFLVSTSGFDPGAALWLWVGAYQGIPTDYVFDLVLR